MNVTLVWPVSPSSCPPDTARSLVARAAKPSGRVHSTLDGFSRVKNSPTALNVPQDLTRVEAEEKTPKEIKKEKWKKLAVTAS